MQNVQICLVFPGPVTYVIPYFSDEICRLLTRMIGKNDIIMGKAPTTLLTKVIGLPSIIGRVVRI